MTRDDTDLAAHLRKCRRSAGLTQRALAERAGVDHTYISRIEFGDRSPSLMVLYRIMEAAGFRATLNIERTYEDA